MKRCPECAPPEDLCACEHPSECARLTVVNGIPTCPHEFSLRACLAANAAITADDRHHQADYDRDARLSDVDHSRELFEEARGW